MDTATFRWQHCQGGYVIDDSMYAELDADMMRAWDGEYVIVEIMRTTNDGWQISGSDGPIDLPWYDMEFRTPRNVLDFLGEQWNMEFAESE
ncbi:MAG TPA: hypothetical protein VIY48_14200 [Candidatus Paceibacterota bacterium]